MSRSPIPACNKTACRMEVLGKVVSLSFDASTNSCLATTVINGAHAFHMDEGFYGDRLASGMSASSVESYPYKTVGNDPLLCGCFVGQGQFICLGAASGSVTTVSRRSRGITGSFLMSTSSSDGHGGAVTNGDQDEEEGFDLPVRSLAAVPEQGHQVLACTEAATAVIDVERSIAVLQLVTPVPRGVGATPLSPTTFVTANYDGKALLYDTRQSLKPAVVLSIPDQITCITRCPETAQVCVGTVAGRIFTLRCSENDVREQAFGTGKKRSPIRAIAMYRHRIVAGDIGGKLSILDTSDVPNSTRYWMAEDLLPQASGEAEAAVPPAVSLWRQAEVSSVALAKGIAWASFSSPDSMNSQVVALPA